MALMKLNPPFIRQRRFHQSKIDLFRCKTDLIEKSIDFVDAFFW